MIASHYDIITTISDLRKICRIGLFGVSLNELLNISKYLGLDMQVLKGRSINDNLDINEYLPCITLVKQKLLGIKLYHYVVIQQITNNHVYVWDPNPIKGIYKVSRDSFIKLWSGYIIIYNPSARLR